MKVKVVGGAGEMVWVVGGAGVMVWVVGLVDD